MINIISNYLITHTPLLYLTQSLWRDEAFSVLLAEKGLLELIKLTAKDFNPPLYYLLLHFWMAVFGRSEISIRALSFTFHLLLVYIAGKFAKKIFKSEFGIWNLEFGILLNPMLLYYGLEARMYSLLALLATLSMYHFFQKSWGWYILFTTLGLYTQPFMAFVVTVQLAHILLTSRWTVRAIKPIIVPLILYFPWILIILTQLKQTGEFWIRPMEVNLIVSSLGSLFLGFEGKPSYLWNFTKVLSLAILLFALKGVAFSLKKIKASTFLFFLWIFLPLLLTFSISFLKPIYVNRYLIFVTVGETFLIFLGIERLRNKRLRQIFAICHLLFAICFDFYFAPFHKKMDFRKTMTEINQFMTKEDIILANSPLSFFETSYYAKDRSLCFLLNKKGEPTPTYLGKALIPQDKVVDEFPYYPKRAFLVHSDGSFEIVYNLY